ncbi:MAG: histidinol dehydrogenase, partial [Nitrospirota bacterium]|nr:histidinol dehydrogenase [Nitrospirota bacterium]
FLGHYTAEAVGDYAAGPNHVLPTGGTARFSSPLSVHHFVKRSSVIAFSKQGLHAIGDDVMRIADMEGLEAHGLAVKVRMQEN